MLKTIQTNHIDKKIFLLIFGIVFTVFVLSNDGHRYSSDEDLGHIQANRIVTFEHHPKYVEGEKPGFEIGMNRVHLPYSCRSEYLCSAVFIGHAFVEVPFFFINHHLGIITNETLELTNDNFNDSHYVWWRNSQTPDATFTELFFGPIFSALSVATFYLICRRFENSIKTSIYVSLLFGFTTAVWAYSQTSFNLVPNSFFVLLSVYYFISYLKQNSSKNLIWCGITIGFAFMIRQDALLPGLVLGTFVLISLISKSQKKKILASFFTPAISILFLDRLIDYIRFIPETITGGAYIPTHNFNFFIGFTGLLFSPGLGIFIYYPILLTCFFTFVDFYKKNKLETFFLLSLIASYIVFYGSTGHWHGMNAYASRYMLAIMPFFLIPLASSIEKRNNSFLKIILIILGGFGALANIVYVIQDENWFVWGTWGSEYGLTSIGSGLQIHPVTIWTFEYSQLTHSIITALTDLQVDIYLYFVLGVYSYFALLLGLLLTQIGILVVILKRHSKSLEITS